MAVSVALLRGINLGAARRVAMADVRRAVETANFGPVRSLGQSGNLVLDAGGATEAATEARIGAALSAALGLRAEVVVRSLSAWQAIIASNPLPEEAARDPAHLTVVFLKTAPRADAEDAIAAVAKGERGRVIGREAYIYYPHGIAGSPLAGAALDRALGGRGTARNWNTVLKLDALCRS